MLKNTYAIVKLTQNKFVDFYREKGYECNLHDEIKVDINDLPNNSTAKVVRICDYCENEKEMEYRAYINHRNNSIINKDACSKCAKYKREEACQQLYGTKYPSQLEEVKNKIKSTCLVKYGVDHPRKVDEINNKINNTLKQKYGAPGATHSPDVMSKVRKSMIDKYGFDHPSRVPEINERRKQTFINKYGVDNPFKASDFKDKSIKTCREKYGVDWAMQSEYIKSKVRKTMYDNETAPISNGQRKLRDIIGGLLNYPIGPYSADILWYDGIVVEYDGSGHDMQVTVYGMDICKFNEIEHNRELYFIENNGLKIIRIINKHEKDIFNEEYINHIMNRCVHLLENGHSIIRYDVDTETYSY